MFSEQFTPMASLIGGCLIGISAVMLMAFEGRIAGISGIISRLLPPGRDRATAGRATFLIGLMAAPFCAALVSGRSEAVQIQGSYALLAVAGVLVGFGAVLGGGCTSGHGVCGLSRLSPLSLVATLLFMTSAIVTVFVTRHLL